MAVTQTLASAAQAEAIKEEQRQQIRIQISEKEAEICQLQDEHLALQHIYNRLGYASNGILHMEGAQLDDVEGKVYKTIFATNLQGRLGLAHLSSNPIVKAYENCAEHMARYENKIDEALAYVASLQAQLAAI